MDELHEQAMASVAETLNADEGVKALVGDRVFNGEVPAGAALPHLLVRKGKSYGSQRHRSTDPLRRDVKVECRAAHPPVLRLLRDAVRAALNGSVRAAGYANCVLTLPGFEDEGDGFLSVADTYGCFMPPPAPPAPDRPAAATLRATERAD